MEGRFPPTDEPVVKIVVQLEEKAKPEKLLTFRMEQIPLPPEGVPDAPAPPAARPAPRPVVIPPPAARVPPAERAYYQKGGAVLTSRTIQADRPAGEGTLAVGLSVKENGEWSGIRWIDVPVDGSGVARLADLQPGTYRLLRIYRPKEPPPAGSPGHWENAELQVELVSGKETAPPPLRWVGK
jgi:hypothetical protein